MCLLVKNFIEWLTDYLLFSLSMPYFDLKITKNTREVSWTDQKSTGSRLNIHNELPEIFCQDGSQGGDTATAWQHPETSCKNDHVGMCPPQLPLLPINQQASPEPHLKIKVMCEVMDEIHFHCWRGCDMQSFLFSLVLFLILP